jgi:hypothetical protein
VAITVGDEGLEFVLRREGAVWVARSDVGDDGHVAVVARGIPPEGVRLELVADLAPFWAGRDGCPAEMREALDEQEAAKPEPVHAVGVAAVEELVEQQLAFDAGLRSHTDGRPTPKGLSPRVPGDLHSRKGLWDDATAALVGLGGRDPITAAEAVTVMVNHLTSLAAEADWFTQEVLQMKAVDETIRFHAEQADVASVRAQRAWADWWTSTQHRGETRPELRQVWLDAWRDWAEHASE